MSDSIPIHNDVDTQYLYVLATVEHLQTHITWLYSYYHHWGVCNSEKLYLRQDSWPFMRTNIKYVTETWAQLSTLVNSDYQPAELQALLTCLDNMRPIWHTTKTFLENVIQQSERLYSLRLVS